MSKISCLDQFYDLLDSLEEKIGGKLRLGDCHGRMDWPERGVYFLFEPVEMRNLKPSSSRVVRVGTHALKTNSRTTLWKRLSQHRGTKSSGGGNHRGSIFRLLVGDAIGQQNPKLMPDSWGRGQTAPKAIRDNEHPHEVRVSGYLADMTLLFVSVPDAAGSNSMRGIIERNAIALLSGYRESSPDKPGSNWLGNHSTREKVKRSGLWNNKHVDENYDPAFLNHFGKLIKAM